MVWAWEDCVVNDIRVNYVKLPSNQYKQVRKNNYYEYAVNT